MTATQEFVVPRSMPMIEEKFLDPERSVLTVFYFFKSELNILLIWYFSVQTNQLIIWRSSLLINQVDHD